MGENLTKVEKEYEKVPIPLIEAGLELVRTHKVQQNIDELAENIDRVGLINPLKVYKKEGRYILIAGQKRLLALKKLGKKEVPVTFAHPKDEIEALKISLSENIFRTDLTRNDLKDAIERLFDKYGSARAVTEELGIEEDEVRDVLGIVNLEKMAPKIAEEVKKRKLEDPKTRWINFGQIVVSASIQPDGSVDEDKALELLLEIKTIPTAAQRKRLAEYGRENPAAPAEELLEKAREPPKIVRKSFHLSFGVILRLQKAAETEDKELEDLVEIALVEWLYRRGY